MTSKHNIQQRVFRKDVLAALNEKARLKSLDSLRILSQKDKASTISILLNISEEKNQKLKAQAIWALACLPLRSEPNVVKVFIERLEHDRDHRIRLCCAIGLMSAKGPLVDQAYRRALSDSNEKVAQVACMELAGRGGNKTEAALFRALNVPSWNVRLGVCKALILLKVADKRVVEALEKMVKEPEAKKYDAQIAEMDRLERSFPSLRGVSPEKTWGKIGTILEQARSIAAKNAGH